MTSSDSKDDDSGEKKDEHKGRSKEKKSKEDEKPTKKKKKHEKEEPHDDKKEKKKQKKGEWEGLFDDLEHDQNDDGHDGPDPDGGAGASGNTMKRPSALRGSRKDTTKAKDEGKSKKRSRKGKTCADGVEGLEASSCRSNCISVANNWHEQEPFSCHPLTLLWPG